MTVDAKDPLPSAAEAPRRPRLLLGAVLLAVYLVRLIGLMRLPDDRLIAFVPDDAFYYLRLGSHFARLHRWTFDGTAPATGFHLLWGYMTASLYVVAPHLGWRTAILLAGVFGSVALAVAAMLVGRVLQPRFGRGGLVAVAGLFLSTAVLPLPSLPMEAPLPILAGAAALWLIARDGRTSHRAAACMIGLAGTLGRSDFGLLTLMLLVAAVVFATLRGERLSVSPRTVTGTAGGLLAGAAAGVVAVLIHCRLVSGHFTQGSAEQKLMWSASVHHNLAFSMDLLRFIEPVQIAERWMLDHHHPTYRITQLAVLLLCGPPLVFAWKQRRSADALPAIVFASTLTLLGYIFFYRFDSYSIQIWYTANILLPLSVLLACDVWLLSRRVGLFSLLIPVALGGFGLSTALTPRWPDQERLLAAAERLRAHPPTVTVGAWNAGILSVVSGDDRLVNLDGLVNDDIHAYAEHGRLIDYLHRRDVQRVIDYDNQFTSTIISGMPLGDVARCFGPPVLVSDRHANGWGVWPSVVVQRTVLPCDAAR